MNTMTCKILTASIVLALSCGLGAEAKGSKTKIMTDPSITQKAIEAQMNQTVANKDVNFNNMLLQKNLASSITEAAAPEAAAMDIDHCRAEAERSGSRCQRSGSKEESVSQLLLAKKSVSDPERSGDPNHYGG